MIFYLLTFLACFSVTSHLNAIDEAQLALCNRFLEKYGWIAPHQNFNLNGLSAEQLNFFTAVAQMEARGNNVANAQLPEFRNRCHALFHQYPASYFPLATYLKVAGSPILRIVSAERHRDALILKTQLPERNRIEEIAGSVQVVKEVYQYHLYRAHAAAGQAAVARFLAQGQAAND